MSSNYDGTMAIIFMFMNSYRKRVTVSCYSYLITPMKFCTTKYTCLVSDNVSLTCTFDIS